MPCEDGNGSSAGASDEMSASKTAFPGTMRCLLIPTQHAAPLRMTHSLRPRILATGNVSFVGSHLCQRSVAAGSELFTVVCSQVTPLALNHSAAAPVEAP
jgi:hypothetical protein